MRLDDENAYATDGLDREFRILVQAASVPIPVITAATRSALGRPPASEPEWGAAPLLPAVRPVELDATTESPLNDAGAWLDAGTLDAAALAALDAGAAMVTIPAWRTQLTGTTAPLPSTADSVPTGSTVWLAEPTPLSPGATRRDGDALVWTSGRESVTITGVSDPASLVLPARTRLVLRRGLDGTFPPERVTPALAAAWRETAGDPGAAIGAPAPAPLVDDVLARRHRVLAEVQEHYYAAPPAHRAGVARVPDRCERAGLPRHGEQRRLGRHAHPHVVEAGTRQMHLLNTNSRFHYRAITDYADRIAATLPDGFDTVFFVNSGSEATDLAIRLAMAATGRPDIVAMREAYHGWTYASDAVSTSIADNPFALEPAPSGCTPSTPPTRTAECTGERMPRGTRPKPSR